MHLRVNDIAAWLRERVAAAGARGIVVGLSGDLGSAVVAGLARAAVGGERVVGLILPCRSDPQDAADAQTVADGFGIRAATVDLTLAFDTLIAALEDVPATAASQPAGAAAGRGDTRAEAPAANVKRRLRMTALYFVANSLDYLVAGAANRCELSIGLFTKYGDGGVDLLPLGDLTTSEVRALAVDLRVPDPILQNAPGAKVRTEGTDEGETGFTYAELERYLKDGPDAVAPALALRVERLVRRSEHKRAPPPTPAGDDAGGTGG